MQLFDESQGRLTTELERRTIAHVLRKGLELIIVCDDGHEVVLAADVDYNIRHKRTDVSVMVQGLSVQSQKGRM